MASAPERYNPERAKHLLERLDRTGWSMYIIREKRVIFSTTSPGVIPLLNLIRRFPSGLAGAIVVDRVVGICAARIFCHLQVGAVFARTLSCGAREQLARCSIPCYYQQLVTHIRNRTGDDLCPFEKLAQQIRQPETLIRVLEEKIKGGT